MRTISYSIFIVFITLFLSACSDSTQEPKKKDNIKIVKILNLSQATNSNNWIEFPAQIHPFKNSVLAFELSGKVIKFNFKLGDKLKKGDIIAELDNTIYKSNFNAAKANYDKALADYKRYQKLYKLKTISVDRLEQSKQNLDVTKSNYDIAKKNFENTKLVAEFDGILAQKYIDDFARVNAKQKIALLQDDSRFKVKFYVPENDILSEHRQTTVKEVVNEIDMFTLLGENNTLKYRSTLIDISREAEDVTRTYEATAVFEKPKDVNILAGMTAKVLVIEKNKTTSNIFIPLNSLFSDSTKSSFVWVVNKENKVKKTKVTTGRLEKDSIEIVTGLEGNELIVLSGVNLLEENQKVKAYKKLGN